MVSALDSRASSQVAPWPGKLCCVLGRHFTLEQCFSPPRSINGYWRIVGENLTNCGAVTCDGQASHPGGVQCRSTSSHFMLQKRDNLRQL